MVLFSDPYPKLIVGSNHSIYQIDLISKDVQSILNIPNLVSYDYNYESMVGYSLLLVSALFIVALRIATRERPKYINAILVWINPLKCTEIQHGGDWIAQ